MTTTAVGTLHTYVSSESWPMCVLRGLIYSVPLMCILLAHEMGHYLNGRRFGLDLTPPYFLPGVPPFGTFGAFIKIRSPLYDRNVLIRVGAWGPIAGSLIAIPMLALGLYLSEATHRDRRWMRVFLSARQLFWNCSVSSDSAHFPLT